MMRPIELTASGGPEGAPAGATEPDEGAAGAEVGLAVATGGAAAEADPLAAFMMSSARISPPGPDPRSFEMSTPCSRARRRAFGEILAPAAETGSGAAGAAAAAAAAGAESILRPV